MPINKKAVIGASAFALFLIICYYIYQKDS